MRITIIAYCGVILAFLLMPAQAAPFSSIVIDASNGRILQSYRAEQARHPASLAKLMTIYIVLEEIEAGRLAPTTPIKISARAIAQPPSHLNLKMGASISAQLAIKALIVKSANDVATAIAEHIATTEPRFAARMTRTARQLGMDNTHFTNASGLHHRRQRTTASDMAFLSKALLERFAHFEPLWNVQFFRHAGALYVSHNRIPRIVVGGLGMKTGYINASGYNITSAVERDKRRVIIVVMGGRTARARDRQVVALAKRALPRAQSFAAPHNNIAQNRRALRWLTENIHRPEAEGTVKALPPLGG